MRQSTRLIVNMIATFGRMSITFGMGLVVTRLLLNILGPSDYGLMIALGAGGALLALATEALSFSAQRHLAYEIGRGDDRALRETFNTILGLFLVVGGVIWITGAAIGPLILRVLTIPPGREKTAFWVYQLAVVGMAMGTWTTPHRSIITSRQAMVCLSIFNIVLSIIRLAVVVAIMFMEGDRLLLYAWLFTAAVLANNVALAATAMARFPEARPRLSLFRRGRLRELSSYAGWTLLNSIGWRIRSQGGTLLLNIFFGPVVNAAYGIATQVVGYVVQFGQAIQVVAQPAAVGAEARGDRRYLHLLTLLSSKYIVILLGFLLIPLWVDTPAVLGLWLGQIPPHTVMLVRLVLVWSLLDRLTQGHLMALQAEGDIGWYSRLSIVLSIITLALATVGIYGLGFGPWCMPAASVVMSIAVAGVRVVGIGRRLELPPGQWARQVVTPAAIVLASAAAAAVAVTLVMAPGPWRVLVITGANAAVLAPLAWMVGLQAWEREHFKRVAVAAAQRMRVRNSAARPAARPTADVPSDDR